MSAKNQASQTYTSRRTTAGTSIGRIRPLLGYNVLEKLRAGEELTAKDKAIHEQGLVSVPRQIHDDLDTTVLDAYG